MKGTNLEDRLIHFAARILTLSESLPKNYIGQHFSKQIIRSGTSCALNYGEAREAESSKDFIHKMKVCLKELRETHICLKIIRIKGLIKIGLMDSIMKENNELISIFVSSIKTARLNQTKN